MKSDPSYFCSDRLIPILQRQGLSSLAVCDLYQWCFTHFAPFKASLQTNVACRGYNAVLIFWSFPVGCWAWYSSQCEINLVVFGSSVIVKVSWDVNKTWDYWEQQYPSVVPFTISQYQLQTSLTFDLSLVVTVACFTAVSSQDMRHVLCLCVSTLIQSDAHCWGKFLALLCVELGQPAKSLDLALTALWKQEPFDQYPIKKLSSWNRNQESPTPSWRLILVVILLYRESSAEVWTFGRCAILGWNFTVIPNWNF